MRACLPVAMLTALAVAVAGCSPSGSSTSAGAGGAPTSGSEVSAVGSGDAVSSSSVASGSAVSSSGAGQSSPTAPIHFIGRFDTQDPAGPSFGWPGSAILTRFSGTGLDVKLHDNGTNQFSVVIDGAAPTLLKTSSAQESYSLAAGLPDTTHDVVITKRTESSVGIVQFLGFTPAGGKPLIETPAPFQRRIEFIGDSITCGYGDEGADQSCPFTPDTENESLAYGALTAKSLNAEHFAIAYSGKGAFKNYGGSTMDVMPELYNRSLADVPGSAWNFSAWTPDVVVINLGTNDFYKDDPGQPFADAYLALVKTVRGHYPGAYIFCVLGSMLSDDYPPGVTALTKARGYITAVVESVKSSGDVKVAFLEFPIQDAANGLGCDYHPSLKTHQLMADKLKAAIQGALGW